MPLSSLTNSAISYYSPFRLRPFTVDPAANEVIGPSGTIRIERKAMAVLVELAHKPGEVVTREALLESAWPDVIVTESTLTRVVSLLRTTLGDDPKAPRFIETVPRVGYRLVAPVEPVDRTDGKSTNDVWEDPKRAVGWQRWAALGAIVGLVALLAVWLATWPDRSTLAEVHVHPDGTVSQITHSSLGVEPAPGTPVVLSPDGDDVAVVTDGVTATLWRIGLGADPAPLAEAAGMTFGPPAWSPDGETLALVVVQADSTSRIATVPASGGGFRFLVSNVTPGRAPSWSADGRHLFFASERDGARHVWQIGTGGGEPSRVTSGGGDTPQVAPDGETLYITMPDRPGLFALSLATDSLRQRLPNVVDGTWAVTERGVVVVTATENGLDLALLPHGATSRLRSLAHLDDVETDGIQISATRDGIRLFVRTED